MKFSSIFKVVGAAALAAGLLPHKVDMNDETGELEVDALLWQVKRDAQGQYALNLLPKVPGRCKCEYDDYDDEEFDDLFTDEATVTCDMTQPQEAPEAPAAAAQPPVENLDEYSGIEIQYNDDPINKTNLHDVLDNISYEKTDMKLNMPKEEPAQAPAEDAPAAEAPAEEKKA